MATLGGVFLASRDPERLMQWFERLGLHCERQGEGGSLAIPHGDEVIVFGIQKASPEAPRPPPGRVEPEPYGRQPMMLNVRVTDLDATVAALREARVDVAGPRAYQGIGRFAWVRTPDGHDVELWQA